MDIHFPFDRDNKFELITSWAFWILNLLQISAAILVVFFYDMNWIVTEPMRTLAFWNVIIGGSMIVGRFIIMAKEDDEEEDQEEDFIDITEESGGIGGLGILIGGVVVIAVGIMVLPEVANQVNIATQTNNVTGVTRTIQGIVPLFFAMGV